VKKRVKWGGPKVVPNRFMMLTAAEPENILTSAKSSAVNSAKEIFPPYMAPDESSVPKVSTNFIGSVQSFVNESLVSPRLQACSEFKLNVVLEDRVT
jgi:hypothetical protein